jgi:CHAT domain-containing protein
MLLDERALAESHIKRELFDLGAAHELYNALLGPVEVLIKNKRHLLVVPSGALTALPFHLLVTDAPAVSMPIVEGSFTAADAFAYRNAAWLIKRQAVTVLPSIASLRALRGSDRVTPARKPLIGFGDPVFRPDQLGPPLIAADAQKFVTRAYTDFWRGIGVDRARLSDALPPLPETAAELAAIAAKVGATASDIHLGADASETMVKQVVLSDYRIVYFATHGLVAGDVKDLAEPALALTIPTRPSDLDDGLLTASEVAQLKLNADWVVLSACNTMAGDRPGAEALSGLARAFFYAGARALLVTHWPVASAQSAQLP